MIFQHYGPNKAPFYYIFQTPFSVQFSQRAETEDFGGPMSTMRDECALLSLDYMVIEPCCFAARTFFFEAYYTIFEGLDKSWGWKSSQECVSVRFQPTAIQSLVFSATLLLHMSHKPATFVACSSRKFVKTSTIIRQQSHVAS